MPEDLPPVEDILLAIEDATEREARDELEALCALLEEAVEAWEPWPHQEPPPGAGIDWYLWALIGGRGSGKTDGGANAMNRHMEGPACDARVPGGHYARIIAPTFGDGIAACVYGPSGLLVHNPGVRLRGLKGGISVVEWPNGAQARIFGAHSKEDVQRLRAGGNSCFDWIEEFAAIRELQDAIDNAAFGLRLGPHPHGVLTSTPRNRPEIKAVVAAARSYRAYRAAENEPALGDDPDLIDPPREDGSVSAPGEPLEAEVVNLDRVVVTHATTDDNPALAASVRAGFARRYAGTILGAQELGGQLVADLGTWFQRAWFGTLDGPSGYPMRVRSWDLAATPEDGAAGTDPDWTVGVLCAFEAHATRPGSLNVEDLVRDRLLPGAVYDLIVSTAVLDGPSTLQLFQQDPGQAGKSQIVTITNLLAGKAVVVSYPPSGPKPTRIFDASAKASQGHVTLTRAAWNLALLDEADAYPNGPHDDQLDALSFAIGYLEGYGRPAGVIGATEISQARLPKIGQAAPSSLAGRIAQTRLPGR